MAFDNTTSSNVVINKEGTEETNTDLTALTQATAQSSLQSRENLLITLTSTDYLTDWLKDIARRRISDLIHSDDLVFFNPDDSKVIKASEKLESVSFDNFRHTLESELLDNGLKVSWWYKNRFLLLGEVINYQKIGNEYIYVEAQYQLKNGTSGETMSVKHYLDKDVVEMPDQDDIVLTKLGASEQKVNAWTIHESMPCYGIEKPKSNFEGTEYLFAELQQNMQNIILERPLSMTKLVVLSSTGKDTDSQTIFKQIANPAEKRLAPLSSLDNSSTNQFTVEPANAAALPIFMNQEKEIIEKISLKTGISLFTESNTGGAQKSVDEISERKKLETGTVVIKQRIRIKELTKVAEIITGTKLIMSFKTDTQRIIEKTAAAQAEQIKMQAGANNNGPEN